MQRLSNSLWHDGVQYVWTIDTRGALGIVAFDLKSETRYFPTVLDVHPETTTVCLSDNVMLELPSAVGWMQNALNRVKAT